MRTWRYHHPELDLPWHTRARDREDASKRFEDCWALRVGEGLLEDVDGSFYDGRVGPSEDRPGDLCPKDLSGHMVYEDPRPSRREWHQGTEATPVACLLCSATGWKSGGASSLR